MSHVYSFAFIAAFLYYIKKFFDEGKTTTVIIAAVCLGIIMLIRPVNLLIILTIPFLAGSSDNLKEKDIAPSEETGRLVSDHIDYRRNIFYSVHYI